MNAEPDVALSVSVDRAEGVALVTVAGELEFGTAAPLRTALVDLAHDDVRTVTIDLAGIDFIDSTGVSLLVQAKQRLDAQGAAFVLRSPSLRVMRVLEVAGLGDLFTIE